MAIYLVQHGLSNPAEKDLTRGLSEQGISDVTRIGEVAAGYHVRVDAIFHSGKKRSLQTAEILARHLNPPRGVSSIECINPGDNVIPFAEGLEPSSCRMYVGHLPFMERLASYLVTGNQDFTPFRFQNGGIVCLDRDEGAPLWYIRWALMPNVG